MKRTSILLVWLTLQGCGAVVAPQPDPIVLHDTGDRLGHAIGEAVGGGLTTAIQDGVVAPIAAVVPAIAAQVADALAYPARCKVRKKFFLVGPKVVEFAVLNRTEADVELLIELREGSKVQQVEGPYRVPAHGQVKRVVDAPWATGELDAVARRR
jgi:hypothetical protein